MEKTPGRYMSSVTTIAGASVTALALDYMTHAEWGLELVWIRRGALAAACVLTFVLVVKALIDRKRKRDS
jgi:hypothetical protein